MLHRRSDRCVCLSRALSRCLLDHARGGAPSRGGCGRGDAPALAVGDVTDARERSTRGISTGAPPSTVGVMQREFGVRFTDALDPATVVAVPRPLY